MYYNLLYFVKRNIIKQSAFEFCENRNTVIVITQVVIMFLRPYLKTKQKYRSKVNKL